MWNPILKASLFASLVTFTPYIFADNAADEFYVWADVVDVTPIVTRRYERTPTSNCRIIERKRYRGHHDLHSSYHGRSNGDVLPALFGGVLGGVIQNVGLERQGTGDK